MCGSREPVRRVIFCVADANPHGAYAVASCVDRAGQVFLDDPATMEAFRARPGWIQMTVAPDRKLGWMY